MRCYIRALRNYFKHDGRISRREYWIFAIVNLFFLCLFAFVDGYMGWYTSISSYGYLEIVYLLFVFSPSLCMRIRRLHDVGKSGKWLWINVIPICGLYILFLLLKKGEAESNRFGEPPVRERKRGKQTDEEFYAESLTKKDAALTMGEIREAAEQTENSECNARICRVCGERLFEDSRFCHRCGTEVISAPERSAEPLPTISPIFVAEERYREIKPLEKEAEEKMRSSSKPKKIVAAILIAALCVGGGYFGIRYGVPYLQYTGAIRDMRGGNAEKAMETFQSLGNYRESERLFMEASCLWAMSMFEDGEYLAAKEWFESHRDFEDSEQMIKKCNFELGKQFAQAGDYNNALTLLMDADLNEASPFIAECYYNRMVQRIEKKQWNDAYVDYTYVLKYDLSPKLDLEQYHYQVYTEYAKERIQEGTEVSCRIAVNVLESLMLSVGEDEELMALKQSAVDAYKSMRYKDALGLIRAGHYKRAVEKLDDILDYKDSEKYWLQAMYQYLRTFREGVTGQDESEKRRISALRDEIYEYSEILYSRNYNGERNYYSQLMKMTK